MSDHNCNGFHDCGCGFPSSNDSGGSGGFNLKAFLLSVVGILLMLFVFSGLGITKDNVPSWLLSILVLVGGFFIGAVVATIAGK